MTPAKDERAFVFDRGSRLWIIPDDVGVAPRGRYCVGDRLPAALTLSDLGVVLGYSIAHMSKLKRAGTLRHLEVIPHAGPQTLYSGEKVRAWLDGDAETAAAAAPLRSFGLARRRAK